jgi:hypothetical protein
LLNSTTILSFVLIGLVLSRIRKVATDFDFLTGVGVPIVLSALLKAISFCSLFVYFYYDLWRGFLSILISKTFLLLMLWRYSSERYSNFVIISAKCYFCGINMFLSSSSSILFSFLF